MEVKQLAPTLPLSVLKASEGQFLEVTHWIVGK